MSDQPQYGVMFPPDSKRRKVDGETQEALQGKVADRSKGSVDRAKANYLSGQLRLRLQYAKLKVEHGWQRHSLSEVENLYFRHTHLTRPYPVISPGGRRNGRTLSSHGGLNGSAGQASSSSMIPLNVLDDSLQDVSSGSLRPNASLTSTSSNSSVDTSHHSIPSTPVLEGGRTITSTPHAPHIGFGRAVTRYPISRSDSTATVIIESTPSLTRAQHVKPGTPSAHRASPSQHASQTNSTASPFREPFDPMEPTEHIDSQLAALRSMMATSAMPIPLPPPQTSPVASHQPPSVSNTSPGSGLTYDAFWSTHSSATAYRTLLATQSTPSRSTAPLQAFASAPAVLPTPGATIQNGASHRDQP